MVDGTGRRDPRQPGGDSPPVAVAKRRRDVASVATDLRFWKTI
jgi:hypothetical protein